jgi:hypothetical protein
MVKYFLDADEVLLLLEKTSSVLATNCNGRGIWAYREQASMKHFAILSALGLEMVMRPTRAETLTRLREEVERAGSQAEFARLTGVARPDVESLDTHRKKGPR